MNVFEIKECRWREDGMYVHVPCERCLKEASQQAYA